MYLSLRCQSVRNPGGFHTAGIANLQSKLAGPSSSWTAKHSEALSDLTVNIFLGALSLFAAQSTAAYHIPWECGGSRRT